MVVLCYDILIVVWYFSLFAGNDGLYVTVKSFTKRGGWRFRACLLRWTLCWSPSLPSSLDLSNLKLLLKIISDIKYQMKAFELIQSQPCFQDSFLMGGVGVGADGEGWNKTKKQKQSERVSSPWQSFIDAQISTRWQEFSHRNNIFSLRDFLNEAFDVFDTKSFQRETMTAGSHISPWDRAERGCSPAGGEKLREQINSELSVEIFSCTKRSF